MKKVRLFFILLLGLAGCDSFEDVSDRSDFSGDLILGTWRLDFAAFDGVDVTEVLNDYTNNEILTLLFEEEGIWIAQNASELFANNGNWMIDSNNANRLLLGRSEIQIDFNFDGTVMNMAFEVENTVVGGRTEGLSGSYDLSFSKTNIND